MDKKTCKECGKKKEISQFPKNGKHVRNFCHKCWRQRQNKSQNRAYKRNSIRSGYKERENKRHRDFRKENPDWNLSKLAKKFGYTKEQFSLLYSLLWDKQQGKCGICYRGLIKHDKDTNVDHNHSTMQVRSLLCTRCNLGIGLLQDSAEVCSAAAEYLRMSKAGK